MNVFCIVLLLSCFCTCVSAGRDTPCTPPSRYSTSRADADPPKRRSAVTYLYPITECHLSEVSMMIVPEKSIPEISYHFLVGGQYQNLRAVLRTHASSASIIASAVSDSSSTPHWLHPASKIPAYELQGNCLTSCLDVARYGELVDSSVYEQFHVHSADSGRMFFTLSLEASSEKEIIIFDMETGSFSARNVVYQILRGSASDPDTFAVCRTRTSYPISSSDVVVFGRFNALEGQIRILTTVRRILIRGSQTVNEAQNGAPGHHEFESTIFNDHIALISLLSLVFDPQHVLKVPQVNLNDLIAPYLRNADRSGVNGVSNWLAPSSPPTHYLVLAHAVENLNPNQQNIFIKLENRAYTLVLQALPAEQEFFDPVAMPRLRLNGTVKQNLHLPITLDDDLCHWGMGWVFHLQLTCDSAGSRSFALGLDGSLKLGGQSYSIYRQTQRPVDLIVNISEEHDEDMMAEHIMSDESFIHPSTSHSMSPESQPGDFKSSFIIISKSHPANMFTGFSALDSTSVAMLVAKDEYGYSRFLFPPYAHQFKNHALLAILASRDILTTILPRVPSITAEVDESLLAFLAEMKPLVDPEQFKYFADF